MRPRLLLPALLVALLLGGACASPLLSPPPPEAVGVRALDPFLDTLQARTFAFFWDTAHPETGLVPDRWPTPSFSSVAAVGFGLTAYVVGAERGYVTREAAAERSAQTLRFLWEAPQGDAEAGVAGYRGFFYHFLDMETGHRFERVELSTIDTALLIAGALSAAEYFAGAHPAEAAVRAYSDSLYRRVDWTWAQPNPPLITLGWRPAEGFLPYDYGGYNETMLLYLLALGSPTHPIGPEAWEAYTRTYHWGAFYGQEHVNFAPLFGHQYTHVWIDFRGIQDEYMRGRGIDYFENSRRATLAQRAYAIDNPMGWSGYGADIWGLTACDGPVDTTITVAGTPRQVRTYWARGAALGEISDDGTIAPTAAAASLPFAPEEVTAAVKAMRARYGAGLWGRYGFLDAFNPTFTFEDARLQHGHVLPGLGWFDTDYLGIDQGPIVAMIENHRSGLVWRLMRGHPAVQRGLQRAGFTGGWLAGLAETGARGYPPPPPPRTASERQPIVVLGSSTAEGAGPRSEANTWVNRYRRYVEAEDPSLTVVNLARGGYTTYHLLPDGTTPPANRPEPDPLRNISEALRRRPAAVIVNLMSNDRAAGFTVEEQLANYALMHQLAEAADVPIWFTTTAPRDLDAAGRRDQLAVRDALMARYPDHVIDFWTDLADADGRLDPRWDSGDRLHLNDEAHGLLFERVREAEVMEATSVR